MSNQSTLSPSDYARATSLQALLSKAVNDCYLTQSPCPAATMAQLLRATYTLDTFSDIIVNEVCDGDGSGYTAEVTACLTSGLKVSTTVSHSNGTVPFHPNTSGRKVALIPKQVLLATGPNSLQAVLSPPPPPPPVVKKGAEAAAKNQPATPQGLGDVDPQSLLTANALAKATRFRLTSCIDFFNSRTRSKLMPLRAVAQHQIDDAIFLSDPNGPFEHLLGQLAAGVSLACAKAAAGVLNKPLAMYIGGLYQGISGREHNPASSHHHIGASPSSLNSTVAGSALGTHHNANANGAINTSYYCIPNLVVTVFSTDPRALGKVRVREVCLVVHVQNNSSGSPNPQANNKLSMDTIAKMHRIVEVAVSKAAAIAAIQCGATAAEVEATMMPVMPDGSVKFSFWESPNQIVEVMEAAIREVTCTNPSSTQMNPNASGVMSNGSSFNAKMSPPTQQGGATPGTASLHAGAATPMGNNLGTTPKQPLTEFSVGLVVDGGLCYRPQLMKYAFVNNEPEVTGAVLAEQLAALVAGAPAAGAAPATGSTPATQSAAVPPTSPYGNAPTSGASNGVLTYLEDTHLDADVESMQRLMYRIGACDNMIIAGNHLYGSDASALCQGASLMLTNNAVLRLNDVGRVTTLLANAKLYRNSYPGGSIGITSEVMEGDGAAVAHIAIGCHARTLRVGGLLRKEHAAIVNELLRMSDYLERCGLLAAHAPSYANHKMPVPAVPVAIVPDVAASPVKKGKK